LKQSLYIFILSILVLTGCKSYHKTTYTKTRNISSTKLLKLLKKNSFKAKTFESRISISYTDEQQNISGKGKIRILKDSIIWGSLNFLGIPMVKFYITPQKIQYYNKINKEYYDGNFELLQKKLGIELNFNHLQNLLVGDLLFKPQQIQNLKIEQKSYLLRTKNSMLDSIRISPFFKILSEDLTYDNHSLKINYIDYQEVKKENLPKKLILFTSGSKPNLKLILHYKNPAVNKELHFPFSIPNGYQALQL